MSRIERNSFTFEGLSLSYLQGGDSSAEVILFCHANGFSGQCYQVYLEELSKDFHVLALDFSGHSYSGATLQFDDWQFFASQILALLDYLEIEQVTGIGHSLGGASHLLAANRQPARYKRVIALDPVVLSYPAILFIKLFGNPMARSALKRRRKFRSYQGAYRVLSNHSFFKGFDHRVFKDYIASCFKPASDAPGQKEIELSCPPEVEARIFSTATLANRRLMFKQSCPVSIVRPEKSNVCSRGSAEKLAQKKGGYHFSLSRAGHLFCFERIDQTMGIIRKLLE